jgi:hypothetical protein
MQPDWDYVKKATLWPYEDLLKKLNAVLDYSFIRQTYNHTMPQAADFARRLFPDMNIAASGFPADKIAAFEHLRLAGVRDWADFLEKVATREACAAFVLQNGLKFEEVIDVLGYLLRWHFPFHTATRELLDHANPQEMEYYLALKQDKLMCSFDLLEGGRTAEQRRGLAQQTSLPLEFITALIHRADIARLPYVRRKTILPICGAGYDTLAKIAAADLAQMESDLDTYFRRTQGKPWQNFRSVIVLKGLVTGAQALPVILDRF